jgi:ELWxxDGT repeat protein
MKDARDSLKVVLPMLVVLVIIALACGEPIENDEPGPGGTNQTNGQTNNQTNGGETPDVPSIDEVTITKVADQRTGGSRDEELTVVGDTLYFVGQEGTQGRIWATDGTESGTVLAFNPDDMSEVRDLVNFNGALYFVHANRYLYRTEGTEASVELIDQTGSMTMRTITVVGDRLLYTGSQQSSGETPSVPRGLRATDGTDAGFVTIINPDDDALESSPASNVAVIDGEMYFRARDGVTGWQLWRTDGTESGTSRLTDLDGHEDLGLNPAHMRAVELDHFGPVALFSGHDGDVGNQLWMSDGTESGTEMVATINPTGNASPEGFTTINGEAVFIATTTNSWLDRTLWVTDGTESGTRQIHEAQPRSHFVEYNGHLYFGAENPEQQNQVGLWRTDGTAAGTVPVAIDVGVPFNMTVYGGLLFFAGSDGNSNRQLFVSDGTTEGTGVLRPDGSPDDALDTGYGASELIVFQDRLFFTADYDGEGHKLWSLEL